MDHPLISRNQKPLRKRVIQLFKERGYSVNRSSNIVFVCGGSEDAHMRMQFRTYCEENLPEFEIFLPESAMDNFFAEGGKEQFDITDFEELVGDLSHAIVIFPEAPGSFAETGYFSAVENLAKKCILVLDLNHQKADSFISLGPAKKINEKSTFHPNIQFYYENPVFDDIAERLRRTGRSERQKTLSISSFRDMSAYEVASIIYEIVEICSIATFDDIFYIIKAIFNNTQSTIKIQEIASILVGANYLIEIGEYGHLTTNSEKPKLLRTREGYKEERLEISLALAYLYQDSDKEFLDLVERSRDAC